jgi:hypothetical protein
MVDATEVANLAPEIVWDDIDVLRPGMDFKNGVVYVTIPARINVKKTVGRGKSAVEVIETIPWLACVTSQRHQFGFTEENVTALGFSYPDHVILENNRRWSKESIQAFVDGNETAPNPVTLFEGLRDVYEQYVEFSREDYYDLMPLFIMGTYIFRLYKSLGYIHFNGTAASGKSQNLRILEALAFNTAWASSMSSAALYRSLAGHPGTVAIDEAEGWEGERGEELRRILNAGYLDGSTVKRAEKGKLDNFVVASFESYGPKAIASINPLDAVIGSRCLIVEMRPAIRTIREFDKDDTRWPRLRDRLYLWMMNYATQMQEVILEWNDTIRFQRAPGLVGRQWQITQLYVTIADFLDRQDGGTRCDRLITFFNEYFESLQRQQDSTDRIRLVLRSLPEVLRTKRPFEPEGHAGWFHIKTVHEVVTAYIEDDAKDYFKSRTVSKHLMVLGFKKRRPHKQGPQVWLDPEQIRSEFRQRRVEPAEEDKPWLAGEIEYAANEATDNASRDAQDDLWANMADEEPA